MNIDELREVVTTVGRAPRLASVDTIALYDPADGRIVHLHDVLRMEGAEPRPAEDRHRSARETAAELGVAVDGLELLHLEDFAVDPGRAYRVDTARRVLVELPSTDVAGRPGRAAD
ncbi:MAG: hypothetical protein ACRCYR_13075 [Phycicoccus sp.]